MKKLLLWLMLLLLPCAAGAELEAHFLNVGHGDCTILTCEGESMIIDGGTASRSDLVFTYLRNLGVSELKYAFATHPNTDHVGGLPAAFHAAQVGTLYTSVADFSGSRFQVLMETAAEKEVPVLVPQVGDTMTLGSAVITILSPAEAYPDMNDMSIVMRIDYGATSFLFCGDAGETVESRLLADGAEVAANVLRVGHHGSDTATSEAFIDAVDPRYAIISCSERYDNPDEAVMQRLLDKGVTPLCTDYMGTVVLRCDGEHVHLETGPVYIGNANSDVFHHPGCSSVGTMKETNKVSLYSRLEAVVRGYRPCKRCNP